MRDQSQEIQPESCCRPESGSVARIRWRTPIRYHDKIHHIVLFSFMSLKEFINERFLMRQCANKYMPIS
jgi:hypothetical protein